MVTFAYTTSGYHPRISISDPRNVSVFDVQANCSSALGCGTEGTASRGLTVWEVVGGGDQTGQTYSPTPSVGTVLIKVYNKSSALTCDHYTLTITN